MADENIKKVTITGAAADSLSPASFEEATGGDSKRGRSRKNGRVKANRMDAGGTNPGTLVQLASTRAPGNEVSAVGAASVLTESGAPIGAISPSSMSGGKSPQSEPKLPSVEPKVVLSKTKKKSKVLFTAPKPPSKPAEPVAAKKKTMKRVKMNTKNLTRRLKKANKIRKSATDKSIEDVKKELIKMELVKPNTTAPEDVLRQIYSDVETMKKRAL
jgi:hypothetical protein